MKLRKRITTWVAAVLALTLGLGGLGLTQAYADAGDVPAHDKTLTVNDDGTYTLALNVTGDSEKKISKVNVIVIVDRSRSMDDPSGTGAYEPSNRNWQEMYGLVDGEYVQLERRSSGYGPWTTYTYWYNGTQYTGQRYIYDQNATRMAATQAAVNGLANTLLGYNGKDGNPDDTVQMALVSFATNAQTDVASTTSASTFTSAVNNLTANGGTNWEASLQQASGVGFGDDDPTYVIFFSDGAPTFHSSDGGYNNWNQRYGVYGSGQEEEPNMERSYTQATDDAASLAAKVRADRFYTIFAYGKPAGATYMTNLTTAAGAPAENNYSASNTAELQEAFAEILESIETAGIGKVGISDGTTSSVTTTTGEVSHLLTVDENSYKYYRAGGTADSGTGEKYDSTANGGLGEKWDEAPAATFENGAVKWNIDEILENDVTYTVTFDCWPSQDTLDIVADIKNDPSSYDSLDANIQKYIDRDGNLKTNTTATLSYTDTRTGQSGSSTYDNPDPVQTTAVESLAISKKWDNELDGQAAAPITLTVTRDGANHHTVSLSNDNDWTASTFISIGILRHHDGEIQVLETGHDFTFTEPADLGYYWELQVPTIRPMLVDGTLTMLILKDAVYTNPDGADEYEIDGKTYYVGSTGAANLTATNERRSTLDLTKAVDGPDADPAQTFPFTLNVVDSKAADGSADNLNSDYYVWFSVRNGDYVDAVVSGAEKEMKDGAWTGYYYAPSGTDIVVNLKAGDSLRFLNLPTGSTYTFTEGTLPANYAFAGSVLTKGTDTTFSGAQTTKGTIQETNTNYTVTYTNRYDLSDVEITKVWEDNGDQDGMRPTADDFKSYLVLKADGNDVTADNAEKLTVTVDPEDSNKYIAKWTGLDRFADGEEIAYTVEETEIEGYTTKGSPAEDKGTITNTHTPEVTTVTVKKVWSDSNNIGEIRPTSIQAQLKAGNEPSGEPVTLNEGNSWTYTWENLPKYANGTEIAYSADETAVPAGYTKTGPEKTTAEDGTVTFTVTNTYAPTPVSVDPPVQKIITGKDDLYNKGDFTFTIENTAAPEGVTAPMPANTSVTNSAEYELEGKTGYYEFGEITFTMPGTYTYKVTESGSVPGVTNDSAAADGKTITFTVTDDGEGNLVVDPTTDKVELSFTNTYNASGEATITVTKDLAGAEWPADKSLTLTLVGANGAPMPETTTATLTAAGEASFGPIAYGLADAGKTYTYTISEDGFGKGWAGSGDVTATVAVTDKGNGTLSTTVTYSPEDATITNTYKATGSATLEVNKAIAGAAWPKDTEGGAKTLTLTLAGAEGAPMPATTTAELTAAGNATFGPIAYTEADAGKTYTYTISEDGFGKGWAGSGDVTATVKVTDKGDGTLGTEVTYSPENATITNTYEASGEVVLEATKILEGREWADGESFTFSLLDSTGATVEEKSVTANGPVTFSAISYDQDDAGKEFTYTISETSELPGGVIKSADIDVTVDVTDNGDGTLTATPTYTNEATITNTYTAQPAKAQINVAKKISGYIEGEDPNGKVVDRTFTVTMTGPKIDGELTTTITTKGGQGTSSFDAIEYTFDDMVDDEGNRVTEKQFTYTVTETAGSDAGFTYDSNEYDVVVTVKDNQQGKLEVTDVTKVGEGENAPSVEVVNEFKEKAAVVTLHVDKEIDDQSASAQDAEFTFVLKPGEGAPGEVQTKTVMTNGLKGGVDFDVIEFTKSGTFNYTIQEVAGSTKGYTYDTKEYPVVITVSDNFEAAELESDTTIDGEAKTSLSITNVYKAAETTSTLEVTKAVDDTSGSAPDDVTFTFTLAAVTEGAPMPDPTTASVTGAGKASFGEITYEHAGEYRYTITETNDAGDGWTYDATSYEVVVTVEDVDAQLVATAAYIVNDKSETSLTVTNIYDPQDATATPKALKTIEDQSASAPTETFTFNLLDADGNIVETKTRENGGPVEFSKLTFAKVGEYKYTIQEVAGSTKGYTYDTAAHPVTITVTDPGDGQLKADVAYADGEQATIKNTYEAEPVEVELKGVKVLEGNKKLEEGEFTFQLSDTDGNVLGNASNAADGSISFGTLKFTKAGTYTYIATEVKGSDVHVTYDSGAHVITVKVTDKDAKLVAEVTGDEGELVKFTNTYTNPGYVEIDPPVQKVIKVPVGTKPAAATFTFQMKAITPGAPMPEGTNVDGVKTITIDGAGSQEFGKADIDKPGTYVYEISEVKGDAKGYTYDTTVYTLTVKVYENDKGKLEKEEIYTTADGKTAEKVVFTNTFTPEPPVLPQTSDDSVSTSTIVVTAVTGMALLAAGAALRFRKEN